MKPLRLVLLLPLLLASVCFGQFGGIQQPMFALSVTASPQLLYTNNLLMWLKADALVTNDSGVLATNNDSVKDWGDSGTNHFNLTGTNYPVYLSAGGPNNYPAVSWETASDGAQLTNAGPYILAPNTFIGVIYTGSPTATRTLPYIFDGDSNDHREIMWIQNTTLTMYGGNGIDLSGFQTNEWQIITMIFNGLSSILRTNGVTAASGQTGGWGGCEGFTLGGRLDGYGPSTFTGRIAELLWFYEAMSATNYETAEQYLADKYNITIP